MKTTKTGYRITKNGVPIKSIEADAIVKSESHGNLIKENGTYYFFNRKQGSQFVYLS